MPTPTFAQLPLDDFWQGLPFGNILHFAFWATIFFTLSVTLGTYLGLWWASFRRRRRNVRFPHRPLDPVEVDGNQLKIYNIGHVTFDDMIADIDAATRTIYLETYILKSDKIGKRFKEHLIAKANEGVRVYLAFDGLGSLFLPVSFRHGGWGNDIKLAVYGPLFSFLNFLWLDTYTRYHRKILVIDDEIAYLGGMNLGREYARTWRDSHLRLQGPKAREVAVAFTQVWNRRGLFVFRKPVPTVEYPIEKPRQGEDPIIYIRESRPTGKFSLLTIRDAYFEAFVTAKKIIRITNPYFLPDRELVAALLDAVEREVEVHIMVPERTNHAIVDILARPTYLKFIKAGAKLWLYQNTVVHSKTATVDGFWSTIGSANLDGRSVINYEINLFIQHAEFAHRMEEMFADDLTNCRLATLADFEKPPFLRLVGEKLLMPLHRYV